jgi:hypothetical protein
MTDAPTADGDVPRPDHATEARRLFEGTGTTETGAPADTSRGIVPAPEQLAGDNEIVPARPKPQPEARGIIPGPEQDQLRE